MAILHDIMDWWFTIKSKLIPDQIKCEPNKFDAFFLIYTTLLTLLYFYLMIIY